MELVNLRNPEAQGAAKRSQIYHVLGAAFDFPTADFFAVADDGTFARSLAELCAALPYPFAASTMGLERIGVSYGDFESGYIGLFDVGAAGPPCPLYGGAYGGDRMKVMEDALRFYQFFGLQLSEEIRELPDHLTTELEFLHFLTFRETEMREQGADPSPFLRAQRDFLTRHVCRWVPQLQARLSSQDCAPFFAALVRFAVAFFEADRRYAASAAGD